MEKRIALFVVLLVLGTTVSINAQTVYMDLSEPRPLVELGIPFAADNYFFANYSANTIVVHVNRREMGTVPAFSYRRADNFYVASNTKVEAYTNVVTDRGTKRVKMKIQAVIIRKKEGGTDSGWVFFR